MATNKKTLIFTVILITGLLSLLILLKQQQDLRQRAEEGEITPTEQPAESQPPQDQTPEATTEPQPQPTTPVEEAAPTSEPVATAAPQEPTTEPTAVPTEAPGQGGAPALSPTEMAEAVTVTPAVSPTETLIARGSAPAQNAAVSSPTPKQTSQSQQSQQRSQATATPTPKPQNTGVGGAQPLNTPKPTPLNALPSTGLSLDILTMTVIGSVLALLGSFLLIFL